MLKPKGREKLPRTEEDQTVINLPTFTEIRDYTLRSQNRGAILANLFEDYYNNMESQEMTFYNFKGLMQTYLDNIPYAEQTEAIKEMHVHLETRGYKYGS
jgi:hypothetical protein